MRHKNFFRYFTTILCLVLLCTLGAVVWKFGAKPQNDNEETYSKLECCIVSVGDGSCAVLKCGDKSVMIDIGPSDAKTHVKEVLEQMQIYEVDCLLISHPHSDHYGGFKALKDISLKAGVLIAAVIRGKNLVVPNGGTVLKGNDLVILVTTQELVSSLDDVLR